MTMEMQLRRMVGTYAIEGGIAISLVSRKGQEAHETTCSLYIPTVPGIFRL